MAVAGREVQVWKVGVDKSKIEKVAVKTVTVCRYALCLSRGLGSWARSGRGVEPETLKSRTGSLLHAASWSTNGPVGLVLHGNGWSSSLSFQTSRNRAVLATIHKHAASVRRVGLEALSARPWNSICWRNVDAGPCCTVTSRPCLRV